jgi:hypothetical protein
VHTLLDSFLTSPLNPSPPMVQGDTGGAYKKCLLALIGEL